MTAAEAVRVAGETIEATITSPKELAYLKKKLTKLIIEDANTKYVSQAEAFRRFGRAAVERWKGKGLAAPLVFGARSIRYDYQALKELERKGL